MQPTTPRVHAELNLGAKSSIHQGDLFLAEFINLTPENAVEDSPPPSIQ